MNDVYYCIGLATGISWGYALAPSATAPTEPVSATGWTGVAVFAVALVTAALAVALWAHRRMR